jgi:hypothetical protein
MGLDQRISLERVVAVHNCKAWLHVRINVLLLVAVRAGPSVMSDVRQEPNAQQAEE